MLGEELVACVRPRRGQKWHSVVAEELPLEAERDAVAAAAVVVEAEVVEVTEREVHEALPRGG